MKSASISFSELQNNTVGKKYISLRSRFILFTSLMLLVVFGCLSLVLGWVQTRTIRSRIEKQSLVLAQNLASVSRDDLVVYNYVALEQIVNQTTKMPEVLHVIIHDKENRVAGYSGRPDLQGRQLTDDFSLKACSAELPTVSSHKDYYLGISVMEAVVPVYLSDIGGIRWGIVRVFISLEPMYLQIRNTLFSILGIGLLALAIGIWMADVAARRVTRPLEALVDVTVEAAKGNLDQELDIQTRDEVEILASNFSVMIREILAQKGQLENQVIEINQLRKYAEKILATMSDGLLAVDMNGRITAGNPAVQKILGQKDELVGADIGDFQDQAPALVGYIQKILKAPAQQSPREVRLENPSGVRQILVGAGVLPASDQSPQEVIFNLSDITALRKLEAEIRQGQRLADLGVLAAGMAHEIRNPLSAIKTFVALLPQKVDKPGFLDKFQRTVPREINRLNTLIEELLELSRPPKYQFKPTDLAALLRQHTELLEADFKARGVACHWQIPETLPQISADTNQLEKVFINLLSNGAQAMGDGGSLHLDVTVSDEEIRVDVRDTGKGMDQEVLENIFTPFFTTKVKGTGLGLAISHKVISEHGGKILVTSRQGEGSCFSVRLPIMV